MIQYFEFIRVKLSHFMYLIQNTTFSHLNFSLTTQFIINRAHYSPLSHNSLLGFATKQRPTKYISNSFIYLCTNSESTTAFQDSRETQIFAIYRSTYLMNYFLVGVLMILLRKRSKGIQCAMCTSSSEILFYCLFLDVPFNY